MALILQVVAIMICLISFGECVHVLLGDPVTFPEIENCPINDSGKLSKVENHRISPVAVRERGVWKPVGNYEDRGIHGAPFAFNSTVYTDTGLYELGCGGREHTIHLSVLIGFEESVSEGGPAKLLCYYTKVQHVHSIRWEKGQETVLELNVSSGEVTYGPASDGTQSLSPDGKLGDYSLLFNRVLPEHPGDYFCSVRTNGARQGWGDPAAVRLRIRSSPDRTTPTEVVEEVGSTTSTETKSTTEEEQIGTWAAVAITAAVVFVIVAPSVLLLRWFLKSTCSRTRTTYRGEGNADEGLLNVLGTS
ncbi:uncharacterized protein LOC117750357 isoform X2 [Cyclopterus lumpus]|uniref:uncharacterized protein LOC117750357 isoform X2 n=1 Tax=Cyclopterus lumpus TaxID=8103 RepID=UPI00148713B7|nr:uncharacterized protein LOC117750357 isoform X2 [Cyclopterus lumpus]